MRSNQLALTGKPWVSMARLILSLCIVFVFVAIAFATTQITHQGGRTQTLCGGADQPGAFEAMTAGVAYLSTSDDGGAPYSFQPPAYPCPTSGPGSTPPYACGAPISTSNPWNYKVSGSVTIQDTSGQPNVITVGTCISGTPNTSCAPTLSGTYTYGTFPTGGSWNTIFKQVIPGGTGITVPFAMVAANLAPTDFAAFDIAVMASGSANCMGSTFLSTEHD